MDTKKHSLLLLVVIFYSINFVSTTTVNVLELNSQVHIIPEVGRFGYVIEKMNIFCYDGDEKEAAHLLRTVNLLLDIDGDDFTCYIGSQVDDVKAAQESHKSYFSFNIFSTTKKRNLKLDPFNRTCIGIETASEYSVSVQTIRVDLTKLGLLVGGLFLFFLSSTLSKNSAFYYLCGILIGNCASILVIFWFLSKFIPKKALMYGTFLSGSALFFYALQIVWDNVQMIFVLYQKYVLIYLVTSSVVSFGLCYYFGPPKSNRSKNLIMWTLQLLGLAAIYFSSDFLEAIAAIITVSIIIYYLPFGKLRFSLPFKRIRNRLFPPKPKLITKEEFDELGRKETEKALNELRDYMKSPKCNSQWKIVMNLSNPSRFAQFVEGNSSHVTLDETREYENTFNDMSDDDSSEESIIEESIVVDKSLNIINKARLKQLETLKKTQSPLTSTPNGRINRTTTRNSSIRYNKSTKNDSNGLYELSEDDD